MYNRDSKYTDPRWPPNTNQWIPAENSGGYGRYLVCPERLGVKWAKEEAPNASHAASLLASRDAVLAEGALRVAIRRMWVETNRSAHNGGGSGTLFGTP